MEEKIRVHVIDRDGRFEADPLIPTTTTMRDFIQSMGKKFNLPPEGPISSGRKSGNYRYYQPINKRTGQILRGFDNDPKKGLDKTFAELGIADGDTIKITEMIVGGADRERLETDYKNLKEIQRQAKKYVTLQPQGNPPDFYIVKIEGIPGITGIENGNPVINTAHEFTVNLKGSYPEDKPEILFLTPIFHPYVFPNKKVCITDGWSSAFPLDELFVEIIDRIQCNSPIFPKSVANPANTDAFNWYMSNRDKIVKSIKPVPFPPDNNEESAPPRSKIPKHSKTPAIDWGEPLGKSTHTVLHAENEGGIQW